MTERNTERYWKEAAFILCNRPFEGSGTHDSLVALTGRLSFFVFVRK